MKENLLNHYVFDLLKSLEQNLSAYTKAKKPKSLHRLRVDIKKIKAVYSFAAKVYKENYDATKLKPLFRKAGKIREMQINIHLQSVVPRPPERLIALLKKKENILIQQLVKNDSLYIMLIKDFRKKVCLPETLPDEKIIKKYFKKRKKKAIKILQYKDRESLHRYRSKIKKILYMYNSLPVRLQKEIELNVTKIKKQQKKLGDWHDTYSALNFLSREHFSKKTVDYILRMKEKERRQFNSLFINLTNKHK